MGIKTYTNPLWNCRIITRAMGDAFLKLTPQHQIRNPVMFAVYICAILISILGINACLEQGTEHASFIFAIGIWLWGTLVFANFAESMAEGRGLAQAQALRKARHEVIAKNVINSISNDYKIKKLI